VVELHVVITEEHLPGGAAVHEHDGGAPLAGPDVLRQEKLILDLEAVGGLRQNELRLDMRLDREAPARRRKDDFLPRRLR
jgi:hypothetical protein